MGVQNINQINNRLKNLSPDQIRSNPIDHIVSAVKGAMSSNNHHVLLHGGGTNPNGPSAPDFSQQPPPQMIPQMQSPMINYRNQGQANYHTANPTSHRYPDHNTGSNSPMPYDRNMSGAQSQLQTNKNGTVLHHQNQQYFPPKGQWMKANELNIVYNRTPELKGFNAPTTSYA